MEEILKKIKTEARDDIDYERLICDREKAVTQAKFEGYRKGVNETIRRYEEELKKG